MIAKYIHGLYITLMVIFCMVMVGCASTKATTAPETGDVTLTWDDVPEATSYNIYWSDKPGVTKKNGTKISNVKNPHNITELKKGKKYYFVVTAVNGSNESNASEEFSITIGQ
jgi:fibronectin type 3 domain-containing protein